MTPRGRTSYRHGQTATLKYKIGYVADVILGPLAPQPQWLKDGRPVNIEPDVTIADVTSLSIAISFQVYQSAAGVYQCIFTDISEVLVPAPIRLDTGQ